MDDTSYVTVKELFLPNPKDRIIFTIDDFFKYVGKTIRLAWGDKWGQYIRAYPIQGQTDSLNKVPSLDPPIITYRLVYKQSAPMGSVSEIKPRIRATQADPNDPQQTITVFAQRFLCSVEFGIWESNWDKVSSLAEKFEEFMFTYTGLFKELGVTELIYKETTDDIPSSTSWRADLVARHVLYDVYIERTVPVYNRTIESIKVRLREESI